MGALWANSYTKKLGGFLWRNIKFQKFWAPFSVTRLGDLLDFEQVFKAFGKN